MNSLAVIILGVAAFASASASWGHGPVADTPEVAAAKAAHFAAVAKASGHYAGGWNGGAAWNGAGEWHGASAWNGAGAWNSGDNDDGQWHDDTHLYDNGQWNSGHEDDGQWHDDTHLYDNGNHGGQWIGHNTGVWGGHGGQWAGYGGQYAGAHGHLINGETPEVAAAKAAHLAAHAAAAHRHRRSLYVNGGYYSLW